MNFKQIRAKNVIFPEVERKGKERSCQLTNTNGTDPTLSDLRSGVQKEPVRHVLLKIMMGSMILLLHTGRTD